MDCLWLKTTPNLLKGMSAINLLDDSRFEQFLRRIVTKLKNQDLEIFNEEEIEKLLKIFQVDKDTLSLCVKTLVYIFKRLLKYVLMPIDMKNDLISFGLRNEKADIIAKLYSVETKATLDELASESLEKNNRLEFSWKVNAELSSDYCKKTKEPKAYIALTSEKSNIEVEATHSELYSMFLQLESIQNELDNLGI